MPLFDWWSTAGTVIQSFFAWTTFNAGQFNANVGWRQNQQYQKKNYSIAWIAVARDDIRDMMSISVNRINNYMVVATLILSVAGSAVVSFNMDARVPPHVVYSVYICTGSSVTFLMLSILFGVKGQNTAFTRTMKLLTYQMRPEPSAEYSHNYMQQSQWLERGGLPTMFRFPGMYPLKEMDAGMPKRTRSSNAALVEQLPASQASVLTATDSAENLEDDTPLEALEIKSNQTTYLAKFANFMQFWLPYDVYAKYTMGMGVIALGQGSAYFALSELISKGKFLVAVPMICLSSTFLITVVIVIQQNYKSTVKWTRAAAIVAACAGNIFATISTINRKYYIIDAVCVPLSYLSHAIFYGLAPCVGQKGLHGEGGSNLFDFGQTFSTAEEDDDEVMVERALDGTPDGPALSGGVLGDPQDNWEDEDMEDSALLAKAEMGVGGISGVKGNNGSKVQLRKSRPKLEDKVPFHPIHNDEFGPSGDWGMTQPRYKADKDRTQSGVVRTVRCTLALITMIWLTMFVWSTLSAIFPQTMKADYLVTTDHWEELPVSWPNPMFRATRLACAAGAVYVSDSHNLFEVVGQVNGSNTLHLRRAKCQHFDPIVDITADCIGAFCYPLVLVRRQSGELQVVNCSSGESQGLQLDGFEPTMLYMWPLLNSSEEEAGRTSSTFHAEPMLTTSLGAPSSSMADESMPSSQMSSTSAPGTSVAASTEPSNSKIDEILSSGRRRLDSLDDDDDMLSDLNISDDESRRRMLVASSDASVVQAVLDESDVPVNEATRTWSPEWPLGVVGDPQRMVDIGASGGVVVTFRRHISNQDQYLSLNHFMAVYNRTTLRLLSRWAPLYKDMNPVVAGCAVYEGTQALVLIGETDALHGSNPPRLVMMSLDASEPYKRWIHIQ